MSGITQSPTRRALTYHDRRAKRIALAAVTIAAALLVALALALVEGATETTGTQGPSIHAKPAVSAPPGTRYDGGPDEGTRGATVVDTPNKALIEPRYDGGPEEGSRGLGR